MADSDTHVATITKNQKEEIRISLTEFKGYRLASMRVWFKSDDGNLRPGKASLVVRIEKLPDLIEALQKAQRAADGGA